MPVPQRRDQRADLHRRQHFVEARPLDVQDFAAQRQDRLIRPVATLLGRAAGRIALDQEQLGACRIALLTIGELARQRCHVESALAARQFARFAGRLARRRGLDDLVGDPARVARVLLEPLTQAVGNDRVDHGPHFGRHQLVLGLGREFRIRHLHRQHAGQAFARVVTGQRHARLLGQAGTGKVAVDCARQRRTGTRPGVCRRRVAGCCW